MRPIRFVSCEYRGTLSLFKRFVKGVILAPWLIQRGPCDGHRVALTFDDGPNVEHTVRVLDALRRHGARGTFFLVGEHVAEHPDVVDRIVAEGHEIANHSWSHPEIKDLTYAELHEEIDSVDRLLSRAEWSAAFHGLFRPPKGMLTFVSMMYAVLHRRSQVLWSIDPRDYCASSVDGILAEVRSRPYRSGDIILLHDSNGFTPIAVDGLLQDLSDGDFEAVTVSELFRAAGDSQRNGSTSEPGVRRGKVHGESDSASGRAL